MSGGSGQYQSQVPMDTEGSYNHCPPRSVEKDGQSDYLPLGPTQGTGPTPCLALGRGQEKGRLPRGRGVTAHEKKALCVLVLLGFRTELQMHSKRGGFYLCTLHPH